MKYDPVKARIGNFVNRAPWLRRIFYKLLDILLLRTWHVNRAIRDFASSNTDSKTILDAGSGFGQYSYRMCRINRTWQILGLDLKKEQIDDCNKFFTAIKASDNVSFKYADLTKYNSANTYDLILAVDVMEHIEEDRLVFDNFFSSLKKGGWLIISTPSDKGGSDVHHDHEESFIDEHVRDGYSIDDINSKLSDSGFKTVLTRYTYGLPGSLSWKLSMKYPILMLNLSWLFAIILPFWYILVMPFALILNFADTRIKHKEGTGLLVIAKKD